jgi:hypothetical protein
MAASLIWAGGRLSFKPSIQGVCAGSGYTGGRDVVRYRWAQLVERGPDAFDGGRDSGGLPAWHRHLPIDA